MSQLRAKSVSAVKWAALTAVASKVVPPLTLVLVARLLTPEDFGVVASAMIVISFSQLLWEGGLAKTLIQRRSEIDEASQIVFWTNLVLASGLYALLFVTADFVATLCFRDNRVADVLRVQGLVLLLGALTSVHIARYQRELQFRRIFWLDLTTTAIPGIVALLFAYTGYGYWSLVFGTLAGNLARVVLVWVGSDWRPKWTYDRRIASEMFAFGSWVVLSAMLGWCYHWLDSLVVGARLDVHALGLYRGGGQLVMMVFNLLLSPLNPVIYSTFSRLHEEGKELREFVLRLNKIVATISLPVGAGLWLVADPLVSSVFGPKWAGLGQVIGILGMSHGIAWIAGLNPEAYRAIGRPDVETKVCALALPVFFFGYCIAAPFGLQVFLWTRLGLALYGLGWQWYFSYRILHTDTRALLGQVRLGMSATLVMVGVVSVLRGAMGGVKPLIVVPVLCGCGVLIYFALVRLLDAPFVRTTLALLRR